MAVRAQLLTALLLGAALAQGGGPASPPPPTVGNPTSGSSAAADSTSGDSTDAPTTSDSTASDSTAADSSDSAASSDIPADSTVSDSTVPDSSGLPDAPADSSDQNGGSVSLTRTSKDGKTHTITVVKTGDDSTGIFAICTPQDDEPDSTPTLFVASDKGPGGIQVTVDKNLIQSPLALITKQQGGDGHIEMSSGDADYLPDDKIDPNAKDRLARCGVQDQPKVVPDTVLVTQGKTRLKGARLVYDESDGIARISGPVSFHRSQDAGDPVDGSAKSIEVNVDAERTTLVGGVKLVQGNRTSTADRVDYDDNANTAILHGSPDTPAQTQTPTELLRAQTIRYFLDTGEAVVEDQKGGISGSFEDSDTPGSATDAGSGVPVTGDSTAGNSTVPPPAAPVSTPPVVTPPTTGTSTGAVPTNGTSLP